MTIFVDQEQLILYLSDSNKSATISTIAQRVTVYSHRFTDKKIVYKLIFVHANITNFAILQDGDHLHTRPYLLGFTNTFPISAALQVNAILFNP